MTRPTVTDKTRLATFVDGELSPEEAAAVVMHLADHPQDQAHVDDLMAANAALAQAFAAPLEEPVPPALHDLILGGEAGPPAAEVLPFRPQARARRRMGAWVGLVGGAAVAAGVVLAVYLPGPDALDLAPGPIASAGPLDVALDRLAVGQVQRLDDGTEPMILATLPTPTGFCREIEVIRADSATLQAALACTRADGWTVQVVIAEGLAEAAAAEGFGTASGNEAQSFTPFLDAIGAGPVLGPEEEAAAIAQGWKG